MAKKQNREKDDLLADLEASITKALEARMVDLAGALYRLQGSAQGWCDHADCGDCPLAPMMCVSSLDERVEELISAHHNNSVSQPTPPQPDLPSTDPATASSPRDTSRPQRAMPQAIVKLYASRLHHQLGAGAPDYISEKIRSINSSIDPEKEKDWKRIRAALTTVVLEQKFGNTGKH